jgi:transposase InsO family protein
VPVAYASSGKVAEKNSSGEVPGQRSDRVFGQYGFLADTFTKQHIVHGQLSVHADHGGPMIAKPVAHLLADLGVTKSHSRPHVSNDNPFSESQFRTLSFDTAHVHETLLRDRAGMHPHPFAIRWPKVHALATAATAEVGGS